MPNPSNTHTISAVQKHFPRKLQDARNWLVWRFVTTDPTKKPRKIPFYAKSGGARTAHGTDKDRKNLVTLQEAIEACTKKGYSGIGLAPLDDLPYCAVDFDNCLRDGKLIKPELRALIDSTYAEISPSGNGLRLIFNGKLGVTASVKNLASGVELFDGTGFVTVTGNSFNSKPIARVTDDVKTKLRTMISARPAVNGHGTEDDFAEMESVGKLQAMLDSLPIRAVDDRAAWLRVGMALHQATNGSEIGFDLWDKWSRRSEKYGETRDKWDKDFKLGGNATGAVGVATLAYMAKGDFAAVVEPSETSVDDDPLGLAPTVEPWPTIALLANPEQWHLAPPPKRMLFENMMPMGELSALAGAGGEGKSWLSLQMAASIGIGFPLCGKWQPAETGKTLILNAEDNAEDYWRRVHALAEEQIWTDKEWDLFKSNVHIAPVGGVEKSMTKLVNGVIVANTIAKRLRAAVKDRGYKMVIIDPAIYFRIGDENDTMVQAAFMDAIFPVTCEGECTVLVVHHVTKGTRQKDELTLEDLRGSTAMSGAVRWAGVMRSMSMREREMYPVTEDQRASYVQMSIVKSSHGARGSYWLQRARGGVLNYEELVATVNDRQQGPGRGSATTEVVTDAQLIAIMRAIPDITQREIGEQLGVSQPAVNKRLKRLREAGLLDEDNRLIEPEDSPYDEGDELLG